MHPDGTSIKKFGGLRSIRCTRQEFYKALPQYKNLDFFIFGESYAGHYVPAVSHYIWQKNQANDLSFKVPLKGLGIGNGLTDPQAGTRGTRIEICKRCHGKAK
eukprot:Skav224948  [mRNA]  locus=scaffold1474:253483:253791:- [translate_table: standard]